MREVQMKRTYGSNGLTIYVTVDPKTLSRRTSLYFDLASLAEVMGVDEQTIMRAMNLDLAAKGSLALVRMGAGYSPLKRGVDATNLIHMFKMLVHMVEPETLRAVMNLCQAVKQELQNEILT
ncbi:hypothetical protein [Tumebacillus flagellatus]|uniref:Uncharacterized protein n=1 Tax=Tumebacillus flagellatus TaxID=1157490 RepID=A0A074LS40_9BACL|nr:hypothetical protein [Tumebacillus flagellatus]KEO84966.1 hypothetical protein EL26_02920 [Tumebacillus flagellatus]